MKPFLPLLLLSLLCSSCSGVYNDPVLTIKNNRVFDSVEKLVNGKVVSHFSSGRVSGVAHYKGGGSVLGNGLLTALLVKLFKMVFLTKMKNWPMCSGIAVM